MVVTGSELALTNVASVTTAVSDSNATNDTFTLVTRAATEGGVTAAISKESNKCKDKKGIETCKLKANLEVVNTSGIEVLAMHIRFFLSDNATFEGEETDTFLGDDNVKKLKAGKSKRLKVKATLIDNPTGKFLLAVDDNDNVLASQLIP